MKWISIAVLVAVLVSGTAVSPAMGASGFGTAPAQVGDLEADLVTITADVNANGTATFRIRYAIRLADENESQAFEAVATDIQENESRYLDRFGDRMNATVDAAASATDREMAIGDFAVEANTSSSFGPEYGLVTYSATWNGFAAVSDSQIRVGDAVEGLFIDSDTQFRLTWAESLTATSVDPEPSDQTATSVVWEGPLEFQDEQPAVILVEQTTAPPAVETTEDTPTTTDEPDDGGLPFLPIAGIGVIIALGWGWLWNRGRSEPSQTASEGDLEGSSSESDEAVPPSDLLSNEERVEAYLESVGGRAKQQEIVEALDWTEAKTSQVLSEMAADETIEKFRIGRENVVKIADGEEQLD